MGALWTPVERRGPSLREAGLIGLLMLVLVAELSLGLRSDGLTVDEGLYIASGYRHLTALDFRACPSAPPLAKMLGALGLLGSGVVAAADDPTPNEWSWAFRFVHELNDPAEVTRRARAVPCLLTVLLVLLLWSWAREAHGPVAGACAVALAAFHPSLLAHGHLATTDMPGTVGLFATSWAFWRFMLRPTPARAAVVALLLAFAVTARLTGWIAVPALAVLWALHFQGLSKEERPAGLRRGLVLLAAALVIVPVAIWGIYGFRYAPWPGATVAQAPGPWLGWGAGLVRVLEAYRVLPEAYLEGARFQLEHNLIGHPAYLLGQRSNTGWRSYYLVAFAVKNTLGFLVAFVVAVGALIRSRSFGPASVATHWGVTALLVFVSASLGRIQIGERYILPVYPYLILLVASAAPAVFALRIGRLVAGGLLALHAAASLLAAPGGYLSYFNAMAGGREGGHRVLLDSNLDWGQDLPRLARWMRERGVKQLQLGYHGSDDPKRFGIECESLPGLYLYPGRAARAPFTGTIAVSPNLLVGLFGGPVFDAYAELRKRPPDERAGTFFIYRLPGPRTAPGAPPDPRSGPGPP